MRGWVPLPGLWRMRQRAWESREEKALDQKGWFLLPNGQAPPEVVGRSAASFPGEQARRFLLSLEFYNLAMLPSPRLPAGHTKIPPHRPLINRCPARRKR